MTISINNPYAGVDFESIADPLDNGKPPKWEHHHHVRGFAEEPADVVDFLRGNKEDDAGNTLGDDHRYSIFGVCDKGSHEVRWPWTEFDTFDSSYENRDPEDESVIAFPGAEMTDVEHVFSLFSLAYHDDIRFSDFENRKKVINQLVEYEKDNPDDTLPEQVIAMAHPERYYDDADSEWERYKRGLQVVTNHDGYVAFEVLNKNTVSDLEDDYGDIEDIKLWDNLLSYFMPNRPIWALGCNDPGSGDGAGDIGLRTDMRFTYILIDEGDFDPSDQTSSRNAVHEAVTNGEMFACTRARWDPDTDPVPTIPNVTDISVDGLTVEIEAEDYDYIKWYGSDGEIVENDSIDVTAENYPYVRAEVVKNPEGLLLTQPFGVETTNIGDGDFGDVQISTS